MKGFYIDTAEEWCTLVRYKNREWIY